MKRTIFLLVSLLVSLFLGLCAVSEEPPETKTIVKSVKGQSETTTTTTSTDITTTTDTNLTTTSITSITSNTNPTISIIGSFYEANSKLTYLNISDNRIYCINNVPINSTESQSYIYGINPSNASIELTITHTPYWDHSFQGSLIYNQYLYTFFVDKLYVYNISNINSIYIEYTNSDTYWGNNKVKIINNKLYYNNLKLFIYDLTTPFPHNMCFSSSFNSGGIDHKWDMSNDYVCGIDYDKLYATKIYPTSCSASSLGNVIVPNPSYDVGIYNNYAYVISGFNGIQIIDLNQTNNLQIIASYPVNGCANGKLCIYNHYAIITKGVYGIDVFDLINPTSPQKVAFLDTPISATEIVTSTNTAYVIDGTSSILFIDLSNL